MRTPNLIVPSLLEVVEVWILRIKVRIISLALLLAIRVRASLLLQDWLLNLKSILHLDHLSETATLILTFRAKVNRSLRMYQTLLREVSLGGLKETSRKRRLELRCQTEQVSVDWPSIILAVAPKTEARRPTSVTGLRCCWIKRLPQPSLSL